MDCLILSFYGFKEGNASRVLWLNLLLICFKASTWDYYLFSSKSLASPSSSSSIVFFWLSFLPRLIYSFAFSTTIPKLGLSPLILVSPISVAFLLPWLFESLDEVYAMIGETLGSILLGLALGSCKVFELSWSFNPLWIPPNESRI